MNTIPTSRRLSWFAWTLPTLLALPFLVGGEGGCRAQIASNSCEPADCAGMAVSDIAKLCADGSYVTESVCVAQPAGGCGWGFPACPAAPHRPGFPEACTPDDCAGMGKTALALICPDGSYVTQSVCASQPTGGCAWGFPPCPADDAGAVDASPPVCECPEIPAFCPDGTPAQTPTCCPIDTCPSQDAGATDSGLVFCACPYAPAFCPDGTPRQTTLGPAPCHCPVASPCPSEDAGISCTRDADCSPGEVCGFPKAGGCSAKGTCLQPQDVTCDAYQPGCACDGTFTDLICNGLPNGYAAKPVRHIGLCVDGG